MRSGRLVCVYAVCGVWVCVWSPPAHIIASALGALSTTICLWDVGRGEDGQMA